MTFHPGMISVNIQNYKQTLQRHMEYSANARLPGVVIWQNSGKGFTWDKSLMGKLFITAINMNAASARECSTGMLFWVISMLCSSHNRMQSSLAYQRHYASKIVIIITCYMELAYFQSSRAYKVMCWCCNNVNSNVSSAAWHEINIFNH